MNSHYGFTLLELLVAVVIAGVLFGLALPTYSHSRIRVERNEGRIALLHQATRQSSFFVAHGRYAADMRELGFAEPVGLTEHGRFTLQVVQSDLNGFVIRAERTDLSADSDCLWFSVDQSQTRQSGPGDANECWTR